MHLCPVAARDPRVDFQCDPWPACCGGSQAGPGSTGPDGRSGATIEITYKVLRGDESDITAELPGGDKGPGCPGGDSALCRDPDCLGTCQSYPGRGPSGSPGNPGKSGKLTISPK